MRTRSQADRGERLLLAEAADLLGEFKPAVVSFHFGLPSPALVERVKAWGSKVLSSATTVEEALWLEAHGVDAIIAQGLEAGGHRGMFLSADLSTQVGTFALVPQIVRAVKLPVIAAGGIADAKGVASAIALGAAGVQIGTAYLLCPEATTSAVHRAALKSGAARHTALTNVFTGRPARGIVNRIMRELGPISPKAPAFPLATSAIAPLRAKAEEKGSGDFSAAVVRSERQRMQGDTRRSADAGIGRRSLTSGPPSARCCRSGARVEGQQQTGCCPSILRSRKSPAAERSYEGLLKRRTAELQRCFQSSSQGVRK